MLLLPVCDQAGVVALTMVDDDQWGLGVHDWKLNNKGYVVRYEGPRDARRAVLMHREVLGLPRDRRIKTDHIDNDPLNNQRNNLRRATEAQNQQNRRGAQKNSTTGLRGVERRKSGRFRARVQLEGVYHHLGEFATAEEADATARTFRAEHMPYSPDARAKL